MHEAEQIALTVKLNELRRLVAICNTIDEGADGAYAIQALANRTRIIRDLAEARIATLTYGGNQRA